MAQVDGYLTFKTTSNSSFFNSGDLWASSTSPNAPSTPNGNKPETRIFYNVDGKGALGAVVNLGGKASDTEAKKAESVRKAVATALKKLKDAGAKRVVLDLEDTDSLKAAAEGAALGTFNFSLKTSEKEKEKSTPIAFELKNGINAESWEKGIIGAYAQNLARELMDLPANMMTPTLFCERLQKEFSGVDNVELFVRDKAWAEEKGMRTFLSVAKGSNEPPKLLEIHYKGASDKNAAPLVFVGKGITFDSGGISLKPSANMKLMRGDMGGAATVTSAALAIAKLKIPINLIVVTPLTENLPGPSANKPGDVVYAINGKTIEIDNTDAEGRLVLADAIYYASSTFKPKTIIDLATLTGAMDVALGSVYSGVFTNSDSLWDELDKVGQDVSDKFWRMPLDEAYAPQITGCAADLQNTGGRSAGSCTAALFLKSFVDGIEPPSDGSIEEAAPGAVIRWAHIDIAGTMEAPRAEAYQNKGMTGRPVRALVEFARRSTSA